VAAALALAVAGALAVGVGPAALALAVGTGPTAPATPALAVLSTHVAYEASLIDAALGRLPAPDVGPAAAVRAVVGAQAARLSAVLSSRGYPPGRAEAVWARLIGDGVPPPGRAQLYVCSVHAQSDRATLASAPAGDLGTTLGAIELTLFVEGQQLADQLGGPLGARSAADQRLALHLLAPLLVASDRAYASAA